MFLFAAVSAIVKKTDQRQWANLDFWVQIGAWWRKINSLRYKTIDRRSGLLFIIDYQVFKHSLLHGLWLGIQWNILDVPANRNFGITWNQIFAVLQLKFSSHFRFADWRVRCSQQKSSTNLTKLVAYTKCKCVRREEVFDVLKSADCGC